jgi:hypothetical protein
MIHHEATPAGCGRSFTSLKHLLKRKWSNALRSNTGTPVPRKLITGELHVGHGGSAELEPHSEILDK